MVFIVFDISLYSLQKKNQSNTDNFIFLLNRPLILHFINIYSSFCFNKDWNSSINYSATWIHKSGI